MANLRYPVSLLRCHTHHAPPITVNTPIAANTLTGGDAAGALADLIVDDEDADNAAPDQVGVLVGATRDGEGVGVAPIPCCAIWAKAVARVAATAAMVASAAERCSGANAAVGCPVGFERIHSTMLWLANSGKAGINPRGLRICLRISSSVSLVSATDGARSEPRTWLPWHKKQGSPPAVVVG